MFGLGKKQEAPSKISGPIIDLDQVIEEKLHIKWRGKVFVVNPVDLDTLFKVTNGVIGIQNLAKDGTSTTDKLLDGYFNLFSSICDNITRDDIAQFSLAQCAAFYIAVMEKVQGRAHDLDKKKVLGMI